MYSPPIAGVCLPSLVFVFSWQHQKAQSSLIQSGQMGLWQSLECHTEEWPILPSVNCTVFFTQWTI